MQIYKQGGIIKAQNGAELTKWINNWYTNRPAQFNNYVMFDQNTAINRSNSINEKYEPWDIIQSVIPNSNDSKSDMIGGYYKKSTNTLHLPNTYKKIVNGVVYEAPINPINLNPSNYIHEKTHGIFDWEQKDQIEGILRNQMKDAYYDSPTEVNSRLMEIRYLNGFDPKHVFNKQEVEQLKKNPNFKDRDIFNRYDSETVVKLLNEVASNQSLKNNLSEYSKQGGVLKAQKGNILPMSPLTFAKYQAYKIVTDPNVWWKAGANWKDIAKNIVRLKPVMEDQNKSEFIFGVKRPETTDGEAYDWAKDIEDNNYKNVKSYEGILNPYNEYIIGNKYKDLVKSLVDSGYSTSLNINDEYSDPETGRIAEGTPYFDDVHGYRIRFHRDKDGNPVISASDLYDFGKNYTESFQDLNIERGGDGNIEWQRKALNLVGQPYKLVQHNIPIKFVDDDFPSNRKKSFEIQVLNK